MLQDNELQIPREIETEIREARHRFHHGEIDDLRGHSMLTMLKVAAGFMWLDGRTDKINDEDCWQVPDSEPRWCWSHFIDSGQSISQPTG